MTEVDRAIEHAYALFAEHVARYRDDIVTAPGAWRSRCDELHQDLQWLLFCKDHPLKTPPRKPPFTRPYPPPPPTKR
jgi:hypothetical protein